MKLLTTADWHLRFTVPSCIDATPTEWMDVQKQALNRIFEIAESEEVDAVLCGGDIFHSEASTNFECINIVLELTQKLSFNSVGLYIMAGNHDLKYHSSENLDKCAIGVLCKSGCVLNMETWDYVKGCNFDKDDYEGCERIFKHVLTIPKEQVPFGVECETPESLLEKYSSVKWLFTGDYHRNFHYEKDGRHVVNSGCLTRQASDFEGYEPGVYVVDVDSEEVKFVPINVKQKFNHNGQEKKEMNKGIEDFVSGIKKESVTLDYVSSLRKQCESCEPDVRGKVNEWIEAAGQ